jgi:hypothetical protein
MPKYRITNRTSGIDLGTYDADNADDALDAMSRDAGYLDHADACKQTGTTGDDLDVREV